MHGVDGAALDYETGQLHVLSVTAVDRGPDSLPAHVTVVIRVDDVNDCAPMIAVNSLTAASDRHLAERDGTTVATVDEGSPPATFVAHLSVSDADRTDNNGRFRCAIDDDRNFRLIEMYQQTTATAATSTTPAASDSAASGTVVEYQLITGNVVFDREVRDTYRVVVTCRDFGDDDTPLSSSVDVRVVVADLNDNAPVFQVDAYAAEVTENGEVGAEVLRVVATDADARRNGVVTYRLEGDAIVRAVLTIDRVTGIIRTKASLDHETTASLNFNVVAEDGGRPSRSSSVGVSVTVVDLDDEPPRFLEPFYAFQIPENQPAGTEVGYVTAVDRDAPPFNRFSYAINDNTVPFTVDADSGRLTTRESLDRELAQSHQFFIVAVSESAKTLASAAVTVGVGDLNDHKPRFAAANSTMTVSSFTPVNYVVARLNADDPDSPANSRMIYSVEYGNERRLFNVDSSTGDLSIASDTLSDVDFEEFQLSVTVREVGDDEVRSPEHRSLKQAREGKTAKLGIWRVRRACVIV